MKRISIFALVLMMTLSLIGCRRKEETKPTQTTPPATQEATTPSIMPSIDPSMDPTIDTNIPDPTVDSNSNQMDDNTTSATNGDATEENSGARFRIR